MPRSDARPLTLLFLLATACLDALVAVKGFERVGSQALTSGILIGQMFATGCWLVGGRMHRLIRGAVLVIVAALLTTIICLAMGAPNNRFEHEWGRVVAVVTAFLAAAAASTALCLYLNRRFVGNRRPSFDVFRYPLAEMFGWMIVIAVASCAMRLARFADITTNRSLAYILASATVAGLGYVLLRDGDSHRLRRRSASSAAIIVAFLAVGRAAGMQSEIIGAFGASYAYFGAWILVDWIDRRTPAAQSRRSPFQEFPAALPLPIVVGNEDRLVR